MTALEPLLHSPWAWGVAAVLLAAAEIVVPGVFLIWLALAAAVTFVVALGLGLPLAADFAIFAVVAIVSIYAGRTLYRREAKQSDPLLNDRAARLIGTRVVICEALVGGIGRARVGDGSWPASGPDMAEGQAAIVTGIDGNTLLVIRAE
jgi:membrane protein implicated in regulation of membrane protease activity